MMTRLHNISVRSQLIFGFGLVSVIILLFGLYAYFSIKDIQKINAEIEMHVTEQATAAEISRDVHESLSAIDRFVLTGDPQYSRLATQTDLRVSANTNVLVSMMGNDLIVQQIETYVGLLSDRSGLSRQIIVAVEGGDSDGQAADLVARIRMIDDQIVPAVNRILEITYVDIEKRQRDIDFIFSSSLEFLAGIVAVVLVLLSFVMIALRRSIMRPLHELTDVADKLSHGEFDIVIPVYAKDEIGLLSQTFDVMRNKLRESYASLTKEVAYKTKQTTEALARLKDKNQKLQDTKLAMLNLLEDLNEEKNVIEGEKAKDEAILSSLGEGLVVTDMQRRVRLVNNSACTITGYRPDEVTGQLWPNIMKPTDENGIPIAEEQFLTLKVFKDNETLQTRYFYTHKGGQIIPVSVTASVMKIGDRAVGGVVVFRDIAKEYEVDKSKTEFVSLASHQLRTPLSTINWYTEMLLSGDAGQISEPQRKYLNEIYAGNHRMVDLVNALLNVSRIEMGTFMVSPQLQDISKFVNDVVSDVLVLAKKKDIQLTVNGNEKGIPMMLDGKLLRIVVENLLSNAIKYSSQGGSIEIGVVQRGKKEQGGVVRITVADSGYGIPESQQHQIFTKLFRADNVVKMDTEGTGLGLYIVKSIVDHVGGTVWFESVENEGTTFFVELPLSGMKEKKGTKSLT
ncbi:MAG: hypothetical protein COU35_04590 [Candidatus Magasanikbacteria bacterium CG10_big_fil_rev_8_21_14_0_10_47_10]|uniref:histidine kinase n=1 Tax=Candidatus Magasanikbacteria bacterium CG10_big_fil_rev_8_21_14_0_10_47_10 TaxID=1974652 RepID=A0A2H0TPJ5_9BACT|nr:MAG: hypothetical protein COU35_04590 [Candidatus Magasanikbacteria bacterium CG10_big_fil_rev_8_21_14_0_10_47_10]